MKISKWYANFLRGNLDEHTVDQCLGVIEKALDLSTHLVRARSVARAAGFCVYYGRMAEKMGVYEVLEGVSTIRGRNVHRILSIASLNLFRDHPNIYVTSNGEDIAKKYVENAIDEEKDLLKVSGDDKIMSIHLIERLLRALPRAKNLLRLSRDDELFPIVEQTFADYRFRIYGAPDLVLENMKKRKAIVVEWKTYKLNNKSANFPHYFEIAQVVAYSMLEARRLGIKGLKEVFESISGVPFKAMRDAVEGSKVKGTNNGSRTGIQMRSDLLKVLPLIITRSGGYPPHPCMYNHISPEKTFSRFKRLYLTFRGVVVASEYLTLQLINIPKLLSILYKDEVSLYESISKNCLTNKGYLAYSHSPFKFLRAGKPGNWDRYPCKICSFKGDGGPCEFYFRNYRDKDYFDKLMWWARYRVFWEREKDLVNHKAIYHLFNAISRSHMNISNPLRLEIDIGENLPPLHETSIVNTVTIIAGGEFIGKFRFDLFKIEDVSYDRDNNVIELTRDLRNKEVERNAVGLLRKSLYLSILETYGDDVTRFINPLHSINAFAMIDEPVIDNNKVIYRCYNPSPVLHLKFTLFGRYLEWYKERKPDALILAFEAPVDLTLMELRAIDVLHRYLKDIANDPTSVEKETQELGINVERNDLVNEAKTIKKLIPMEDGDGISYDLYKCLSTRIVRYDDEG